METPRAPEQTALSERVRHWVRSVAGSDAVLDEVAALPQSDAFGPWRVAVTTGGGTQEWVLHLGDPRHHQAVGRFATEAAALEIADRHGLAVPSVVAADLDGSVCGVLSLLETAMPGSSAIPQVLNPRREQAFGTAIAAIHAIPAIAAPALPLRDRSLDGVDFADSGGAPDTRELRDRARNTLASRPPPDEPRVFVHGDLWRGNTLWEGERHVATLDWDYAGVGPAGIDLGSVRCDLAMMDGPAAADLVVAGYEASGGRRIDVAWWDVVAALCSPGDLSGWLPNFHAQGRDDLDLPTVTERRDAFLRAALQQMR